MARDPDTIQREIDQARDALADSLDALGERVSPARLAQNGRARLQSTLADPRIRYTLIAFGVVLAAAVLRRLFR